MKRYLETIWKNVPWTTAMPFALGLIACDSIWKIIGNRLASLFLAFIILCPMASCRLPRPAIAFFCGICWMFAVILNREVDEKRNLDWMRRIEQALEPAQPPADAGELLVIGAL